MELIDFVKFLNKISNNVQSAYLFVFRNKQHKNNISHKLSQIITNNQEEKENAKTIFPEDAIIINILKFLRSQTHTETHY